ncbi:MAG: baseplate J/gp47 family protein [Deltaproteobacteria bacterium]|nr:baseplate J/gp47 family protein [Deltaproteobacteria bacterium]
MPLTPPNLDDRTFEQLVAAAVARVQASCPEWTDLSPHDPGRVLLEAYAYLTDGMLYRLNRLPEKAYVALLNILGVEQQAPSAAAVRVVLERAEPAQGNLLVPADTEVSTERGGSDAEPPVFALAEPVVFEDGQAQASGVFYHAQHRRWRAVGTGTGEPGQSVLLPGAPLVGNADLKVQIAVELGPDEPRDRFGDTRVVDGKICAVWREVDRFVRSRDAAALAFEVDRHSGRVRFAPSVQRRAQDGLLAVIPENLAAVPGRGRAVFADYWVGGGTEGNVPAGTLTRLKRAVAGVKAVRNPAAAAGGRAAESLENTLKRAPVEVFSLDRAVTKLDYEILAQRVGGVSRARAFTGVHLWPHAPAGSVEVLLVPEGEDDGASDMLEQVRGWTQRPLLGATWQAEPGRNPAERGGTGELVLAAVQAQLEGRQPLGATVRAGWARFKRVRVSARVVANPSESPEDVERRLREGLRAMISPLPHGEKAWPFGRALRISDVYERLLSTPGVRYAEDVRLLVDEVPDGKVDCIAAVPQMAGFWFAGSGTRLFRSQNDGESWEDLEIERALPDSLTPLSLRAVKAHSSPRYAGLVAAALNVRSGADRPAGAVVVTDSTGETWSHWFTLSGADQSGEEIRDIEWIERGGHPVLLVATDRGLWARTWGMEAGQQPVAIAGEVNRPCESVSAVRMPQGPTVVAVALRLQGNQPTTDVLVATLNPEAADDAVAHPQATSEALGGAFASLGASGARNFRVVRLQPVYSRVFAFIGLAVPGNRQDPGVFRLELVQGQGGVFVPNGGWAEPATEYGGGGSCYDIAFGANEVWVATGRRGLMRAAHPSRTPPAWDVFDAQAGLPARPGSGLAEVHAVAAQPAAAGNPWSPGQAVVIAGGELGLVRGRGPLPAFESRCERRVETVSLPPSGLFCSGAHELRVETSNEQD